MMLSAMDKPDWRTDLRSCFEDLQVIDRCRGEAVAQFDRFCDYVAEPAFEALAEEFGRYEMKGRSSWTKGSSVEFDVRFPRSKEDQFQYVLWLPKQAVELKLKLTLRGRKAPGAPLEEKTMAFLDHASAKEILAIDQDALAQDVISRYKRFLYETAVLAD
jgi:hypothetical protein